MGINKAEPVVEGKSKVCSFRPRDPSGFRHRVRAASIIYEAFMFLPRSSWAAGRSVTVGSDATSAPKCAARAIASLPIK
jgi:hypothetical protein